MHEVEYKSALKRTQATFLDHCIVKRPADLSDAIKTLLWYFNERQSPHRGKVYIGSIGFGVSKFIRLFWLADGTRLRMQYEEADYNNVDSMLSHFSVALNKAVEDINKQLEEKQNAN